MEQNKKFKKLDKESLIKENLKGEFMNLIRQKLNEAYEEYSHDDRGNKRLTSFCKGLIEEVNWIE